jgi:putative transferase (TIGR04331 family)
MLLATTALEWSWGTAERLVFLGEWCRKYGRMDVWQRREHVVVRNHWDDRAKLRRDHDYLRALHAEVLSELAAVLGQMHGLARSQKFWRTIVDPWLMRYLGVAFDRWESLRVAFEEYEFSETVVRQSPVRQAPYDHLEFIETIETDDWNHDFYADVLRFQYSAKYVMRVDEISPARDEARTSDHAGHYATNMRRSIARQIDRIAGVLSRRNRVVFVQSYFPLPALVSLNLRLLQVPALFLDQFQRTRVPYSDKESIGARAAIALNRQPHNAFETFLHSRIGIDLPRVCVESFELIRREANAIKLRPKVVLTATGHWFNDLFKHWVAERVHEGTALVTMDHGGCLHPAFGAMDFEEDIADVKATWVLPYHPKHVQMSSNKLVGQRRHTGTQSLIVVGSEVPRFSYACWSGPIGSQTMVGFEYVCSLYEHLDDAPRRAFKVKPYPDLGWQMRERFVARLGSEHVVTHPSLRNALRAARMIVCTYPQTTFSEAMASGIPSLLVYPRRLWETIPLFDGLIETLHEARIVFFEPDRAAEHINAVWGEPEVWWQSVPVRAARLRFEHEVLDLRSDWVRQWIEFIEKVSSNSALKNAAAAETLSRRQPAGG